MESLINFQKNLSRSIERSLISFSKCHNDRLTVTYIETKIENLERDWLQFRDNNAKLYENYDLRELDESVYIVDEVYEATEENYTQARANFKETLNKLVIENPVNVKDTSSSSSSVKLPKISIPVFTGKYEEWTTFRDLFLSLVHTSTSLDNVQKLHYLKAHLTGEAEQLIRHTPIADSNYARCWELLEKRYNNKRFLTNSILNKLFSQRHINVESASALKTLLDTTNACLSALSCLQVEVSTWDMIVLHLVTSKLDQKTRKQWELTVSNLAKHDNVDELPTYIQFQEFLESRCRALEIVDASKRDSVRESSPHCHITRSFITTTSNNRTTPMACEYCSEHHKLSFCKKFAVLDIRDRQEFVANNKICFNCLGGNHYVYQCRKPTNCRVCKSRHHTLLHMTYDNYSRKEEDSYIEQINRYENKDRLEQNQDKIRHKQYKMRKK